MLTEATWSPLVAYFLCEVIVMKFSDHLDDNTKKAMYKKCKEKQKKPPPKKEEKLSFRELERMMGKYNPTYERGRGGAIRRK